MGWNGTEPNGGSGNASLSADGRFVAFASGAANLVPGDQNGALDVFVFDRVTRQTERVSAGEDGSEGKGSSGNPALSADGRYVAFDSSSPNLLPDDENLTADVFVHDRLTGALEVVSVESDGTAANSASTEPSISADGRYVAFESYATNLVDGDTNAQADLFVHDRDAGTTVRVSLANGGVQADDQSFNAALSADGRHVAFRSWATNLVPGDTNGFSDVFAHDLDTLVTQRVSVASDGTQGTYSSEHPSISADGRYVAFDSLAENLVPADHDPGDFLEGGFGSTDVFVHDRLTGRTERVSVNSAGEERAGGYGGTISSDGRYVVFVGDHLVDEDTNNAGDLFVRDRLLGTTERVSLADSGAEGSRWPDGGVLSANGRFVGFLTVEGLVPGDGNGRSDVYLRDRGPTVGIGELSASVAADTVRVSGWARLPGNVVEVGDDVDDSLPPGVVTGAEIVGASLAYRLEEGDLLATVGVSHIPGVRTFFSEVVLTRPGHPGVAGLPGLVYAMEFTVEGSTYQLRALRVATTADPIAAPLFGLYRCATSCEEMARLRGGLGTTGEEVQVAVPLSAIDATDGQVLTGVRAFTALGEAIAPAPAPVDEVSLGSLPLPAPVIELGIAPERTPEGEVVFTAVLASGGEFDRQIPVDSLAPGTYDVWARACVAGECGTRSTTIEID